VPTKAAYKDFEADPDLEFEFSLAAKLGMTVGHLRTTMTMDEYVRWRIFYARKQQRAELAKGAGQ
jgi:hypothetical protein